MERKQSTRGIANVGGSSRTPTADLFSFSCAEVRLPVIRVDGVVQRILQSIGDIVRIVLLLGDLVDVLHGGADNFIDQAIVSLFALACPPDSDSFNSLRFCEQLRNRNRWHCFSLTSSCRTTSAPSCSRRNPARYLAADR